MTTSELRTKIEKLLALAASSNPHEAQLAMSKAQALMVAHNIHESELGSQGESEVVSVSFWPTCKLVPGLLPILPAITNRVSRLFGCYASVKTDGPGVITGLILWGFKLNVDLTAYTVDAILNQALVDYRAQYAKYRSITFGAGFWQGFYYALKERFAENLKATEGLVIYDKTKEVYKKSLTGTFQGPQYQEMGRAEGATSAQSVSLNKPIVASNAGKLLK